MFAKTGLDVHQHSVLVTEPPDMTRVSKETMAEILFEKFDVPALSIESAGVLAMYAQGLRTGIVVDCGNRTKITPVADGYPLPHAILQSSFGGLDIDTDIHQMCINEHGSYYSQDKFKVDMRTFKEQSCYAALNCDEEKDKDASSIIVKHRLHNGNHLHFSRERFLCAEKLFSTPLPNSCKGLPEAITWCASKCESVLRKDLFASVLLCGGTTCLSGFQSRLQHDVSEVVKSKVGNTGVDLPIVNVIAPSNRKYSAWLGGACMARMQGFHERLVYSDEFASDRATLHR